MIIILDNELTSSLLLIWLQGQTLKIIFFIKILFPFSCIFTINTMYFFHFKCFLFDICDFLLLCCHFNFVFFPFFLFVGWSFQSIYRDPNITYQLCFNFISNFQALCEEFEEECCISLAQTIQRHLTESGQAKEMGRPR